MLQELLFDQFESPIGVVLITACADKLCTLDFGDYDERMQRLLAGRFGDFRLRPASDPYAFSSRLRAYFAGDLTSIETIAVETDGTPYQQTVWKALRQIPVGTVTSYGALAKQIRSVARAVGHANSLNPIGIVVPCHRVIGADGALTGYAGGLHRKEWLLRHEGVALDDLAQKSARQEPASPSDHLQAALL